VRDDGQVDVDVGSAWPILNDALNDSISSLPPRGLRGNGPSTYWIDQASPGVRKAQATGDDRPFIRGNATLLRLQGDSVVAAYDYADPDEPGETMPLEDFVSLLARWRSRVQESASTATSPLPETYRRNRPPIRPGPHTPTRQ
jgi:hypothetical protein